jgi:hypothetical protein
MGDGLFGRWFFEMNWKIFFPIGKKSSASTCGGEYFPYWEKIGNELFPKGKLYGTGKWLSLPHLYQWPSWAS